jgi:protein-tyrosine phosphatase
MDLFQSVYGRVRRGESVIVHCAAGIGRAGSFATALCVMSGMDLDVAIAHVRRHRPGAGPEAGEQREVLDELARSLGR